MEHYPKFFGARTRSHWADLEGMLTSSAFRQDVLLRTWEAFSDGRPSCLEFAVAAPERGSLIQDTLQLLIVFMKYSTN